MKKTRPHGLVFPKQITNKQTILVTENPKNLGLLNVRDSPVCH